MVQRANTVRIAVCTTLVVSPCRLPSTPLPMPRPVGPSPSNHEKALKIQQRFAPTAKILGAFEANAFSEHDLRLARERWAATGSPASSTAVTPSSSSRGAAAQPGNNGKRKRGGRRGSALAAADAEAVEVEARGGVAAGGGEGGGGAVYFGLKYLTSSRLLKLQLRDPTLRLQVRCKAIEM